jgi:hypothetical protein
MLVQIMSAQTLAAVNVPTVVSLSLAVIIIIKNVYSEAFLEICVSYFLNIECNDQTVGKSTRIGAPSIIPI